MNKKFRYIAILTQPNGKKMQVFLSSENDMEILVAQQDIIFKQDFETEHQL